MSSWFKNPINIVVAVISVILFIGAAVAITLKVATRDLDEEAPLLEVCWANGQAYYVEGVDEGEGDRFAEEISCQGPSELVWPAEEIPLTAITRTPEGENLDEDEDVQRIVGQVISDFNAQAGCELVRSIPHGAWPSADAHIHYGEAIEVGGEGGRGSPGRCSHRGAGIPVEVHVGVRGGMSDRLTYLVLLHEFGHVFGLGHNEHRGSVMYPLTIDDTEFDVMTGGRFSDGSVNRLSRYCSQ